MAEVIADELRRSIVHDGHPGDYLMAERSLIERYAVSRPTVREALRILEFEGLVEIRRGIRGGAVVREPAVEDLAFRVALFLQLREATLDDIHLVRSIVEPAAARLAAERARQGDRTERLDELLAAEALATASREDDRWPSPAPVDVHLGVLELAGSRTLRVVWQLLSQILGPCAGTRSFTGGGRAGPRETIERCHEAHVNLARAIRAGDPDEAEWLMRAHLAAVRAAAASAGEDPHVDAFLDHGSDGAPLGRGSPGFP